MSAPDAVKAALELFLVPTRLRSQIDAPLPDGVEVLLAIASGDARVLADAAAMAGRPEATIRDAAKFYIEQILLAPGADSYRVLGVSSSAAQPDIRRNLALLTKWLHPDSGASANRPAFTARVNKAWDDVKSPERRAAYDASRRPKLRRTRQQSKLSRTNGETSAARAHPSFSLRGRLEPPGRLRRALLALLGRDSH